MTAILLNALVPIFAVMALGYFAGWIRDLDNHHVGELNALVMDFALPASLFVATAATPRAILTEQWPLLLVLTVCMLALYVLSYWMQRRLFGLASGAASVQALTVSFPNYTAAGLPLTVAVFGSSHAGFAALAIASGSILVTPLTLATLEVSCSVSGDRSGVSLILRAVGRSLLKPVVLSPIVGISFSFLAIPLPDFVASTLTLIGQAAAGVAAFLTGLILSSQRVLLSRNVIGGSLLKNVIQPLLAAGLIMLLPVSDITHRAVILLAAVPCGFFGVLFGLRYGVESQEVGSTLIASSVLSVATLTTVLVLTADT